VPPTLVAFIVVNVPAAGVTLPIVVPSTKPPVTCTLPVTKEPVLVAPLTAKLDNVPTDVMLVWAAVDNVPVMPPLAVNVVNAPVEGVVSCEACCI
jgi:hypothetical protein